MADAPPWHRPPVALDPPSTAHGWRRSTARRGRSVVGIVGGPATRAWTTFWVDPSHRDQGVGDELAEHLDAAGLDLLAPAGSHFADYLVARAYRVEGLRDGCLRLTPPSRRRDLRPAASIALVAEPRRILLGRRRPGAGPWPGYYAFPGGGVETGEVAVAAARRELFEETGLTVPAGAAPLVESRVFVARADGSTAYVIDNFAFRLDAWAPGAVSDEIEPVWMSFEAAWAARPMAAGTRRVLRRVLRSLG